MLLTLPLDKLHCTRFNPRRNFGTEDDLRDFGEKLKKEQLQPAVVVSRAAYLKLWPNEADNVGTCPYVIANGERRYRASHLVGRGVLEVVHREDVAASRASFLDAVQSENNDRQDLDPIERAIAIETMVTELGGADQVAAYYGKTKGWVSQQRKLLKLTPELQDLVSAGEMPVRVARDIAGLPGPAQAAAWAEQLERRRQDKEAGARLRAQTAKPGEDPPTSERFTAVNQTGAPSQGGRETGPEVEARFTAVNLGPDLVVPQPVAEVGSADSHGVTSSEVDAGSGLRAQIALETDAPSADSIPEPREEEARPVVARFPYEDGLAVADCLISRMTPQEFDRMMPKLNAHWSQMTKLST
ncbi:ParB/RepB/Spo0J family partition protein [Streptomyces sp. NPDC053367]|uniref:ParB/RepB/Spo0J family partition protein n=1 Tax=Streptomyces sp. NPDC053367 TaxID=3365700 RepID=UPI0037D8BB69